MVCPILQGQGDSHATATGKTRKHMRWDIPKLLMARCEVAEPVPGVWESQGSQGCGNVLQDGVVHSRTPET